MWKVAEFLVWGLGIGLGHAMLAGFVHLKGGIKTTVGAYVHAFGGSLAVALICYSLLSLTWVSAREAMDWALIALGVGWLFDFHRWAEGDIEKLAERSAVTYWPPLAWRCLAFWSVYTIGLVALLIMALLNAESVSTGAIIGLAVIIVLSTLGGLVGVLEALREIRKS